MLGSDNILHPKGKVMDFEKYESMFKELKNMGGSIALFGCTETAEQLIEKYPQDIESVVEIRKEVLGKVVGSIEVTRFDDFRKKLTQNILITDDNLKYDYLQLIYEEMDKKGLRIIGYGNEDIRIRYNYTPYHPVRFDFEYLKIKASLPMKCNIPDESLIRLIDCIKTCVRIRGEILELGTGLGGSTYFIAKTVQGLNSDKVVYTVDKFEPISYIPDLDYGSVKRHLEIFPFVKVLKGAFGEVLKELKIKRLSFCFIDEYPTREIMEWVYPKISSGGMILIDNYNHGCDKNHGMPLGNLFFKKKDEKIIRLGGTQGLVVKH